MTEPTTGVHVEAAQDAYDVAVADRHAIGARMAEAFARATEETDEVRRLAAAYAIAVRAERYAYGVLDGAQRDYLRSQRQPVLRSVPGVPA